MAGRLSTRFMRDRIKRCHKHGLISVAQIIECYRRTGVSEIRPSRFIEHLDKAAYPETLKMYHFLAPAIRVLYPRSKSTDRTIKERRQKSIDDNVKEGFVRAQVFIHPLDKPELFKFCERKRKIRRRLNRTPPSVK